MKREIVQMLSSQMQGGKERWISGRKILYSDPATNYFLAIKHLQNEAAHHIDLVF
jgi:hypothetical protein